MITAQNKSHHQAVLYVPKNFVNCSEEKNLKQLYGIGSYETSRPALVVH
jgi:hypothetical protein